MIIDDVITCVARKQTPVILTRFKEHAKFLHDELIRAMQLVGINVITRTEVEECFAVIDDEIVWHGGMNLLGKADVWDNLMRIRNSQVATELLEIALGYSEEGRKSE